MENVTPAIDITRLAVNAKRERNANLWIDLREAEAAGDHQRAAAIREMLDASR